MGQTHSLQHAMVFLITIQVVNFRGSSLIKYSVGLCSLFTTKGNLQEVIYKISSRPSPSIHCTATSSILKHYRVTKAKSSSSSSLASTAGIRRSMLSAMSPIGSWTIAHFAASSVKPAYFL